MSLRIRNCAAWAAKKRIGGAWTNPAGYDLYDANHDHIAISFHQTAYWQGVCFSTNDNGPRGDSWNKAFNCAGLDAAFDWSSVSVHFGAGGRSTQTTAETVHVDSLNRQAGADAGSPRRPVILPAEVVRTKGVGVPARARLALRTPRLERTLAVSVVARRAAFVRATVLQDGEVVARTATLRVKAGRTRLRIFLSSRLKTGKYQVRLDARSGRQRSKRIITVRVP